MNHKDTDTNNFCTSGCGIFATVNAIYSLSGHFPDPYELAQYASDKHYRIEDCGTDSGLFKQLPKNLAINMDSPTMEAANPLKN